MEFVSLLPASSKRHRSNFLSGENGQYNIVKDNFTLTTWLCIGAAVQGALFLLAGRLAVLPAVAVLIYQSLKTYLMTIGVIHDTYQDGIVKGKFSAQFPDAQGNFGSKPSDTEVCVFIIGVRSNHPLGIFAPGFPTLGKFMPEMVIDLEAHADEFGFLGMSSWISNGERSSTNELMQVVYLKNVEGLHKFAHSEYHRRGWNWWNKNTKQYPHLSIFHETYQVPKGNWENIWVNSHPSGIGATSHQITDKETGETKWVRPIVDASRGLLKTSGGRMNRSKAMEHDAYGSDPYENDKTS